MVFPLPVSWRTTWLYGPLIKQLLWPVPPCVNDPYDVFYLKHEHETLDDVIHALRLRIVSLRHVDDVRLAGFLFRVLLPHMIVVACLVEELDRLDWSRLSRVAPPRAWGAPMGTTEDLHAYMASDKVKRPEWKLHVADWWQRVHVLTLET